MNKRISILFLCCLLFSTSFFGCKNKEVNTINETSSNNSEEFEEQEGYVSLLTDKHFENGFMMRGLKLPIYGDPIETFGTELDHPMVPFQYEKEGLPLPEWTLLQFSTRYPFHDITNSSPHLVGDEFNYRFTDMGNGKYKYENYSKNIIIDTKTGEYSLGLQASRCFVHGDREQGQEWPHWCIQRKIYDQPDPPKQCHIASSQSLMVTLDVKINYYEDFMGERANPDLHSAMCVFYLCVDNRDPVTKKFTDRLWFGIPVFDNRYPVSSQASFPDVGTKDTATEQWIFNISAAEFFSLDYNLQTPGGQVILNEWRSIKVDVLGKIHEAFQNAQTNGYMTSSKWENLYINNMYCGYEMPGTYDMDMSFKNLDITSYITY